MVVMENYQHLYDSEGEAVEQEMYCNFYFGNSENITALGSTVDGASSMADISNSNKNQKDTNLVSDNETLPISIANDVKEDCAEKKVDDSDNRPVITLSNSPLNNGNQSNFFFFDVNPNDKNSITNSDSSSQKTDKLSFTDVQKTDSSERTEEPQPQVDITLDSSPIVPEDKAIVLSDSQNTDTPLYVEKKSTLKDVVNKLKKITGKSAPIKRFSFSSLSNDYNASLTGGLETKKKKKTKTPKKGYSANDFIMECSGSSEGELDDSNLVSNVSINYDDFVTYTESAFMKAETKYNQRQCQSSRTYWPLDFTKLKKKKNRTSELPSWSQHMIAYYDSDCSDEFDVNVIQRSRSGKYLALAILHIYHFNFF